jgi:hypothetical protein
MWLHREARYRLNEAGRGEKIIVVGAVLVLKFINLGFKSKRRC